MGTYSLIPIIYMRSQLILSIIIPIVILHYFSMQFYNLSLWHVIKWWVSNISNINNAFPTLLGLFFTLFVYFLSISGLVNILFLSVAGEKQELVYLGNISGDKSIYYDVKDASKTPIVGYDMERKYNFSFNNLYRSELFLKDKYSNSIGTRANRLHVLSFLASSIAFIAFTFTTVIIFNILIHAAYVANPTDIKLPTDGALLAFDSIANKFGFSRKEYFILTGGLIIVWLGLNIATPKNKVSEPLQVLPSYIKNNKTILGIPNEITIRYVKQRRSADSNSNNYVDSGERYINFSFTKGFEHTVYVATLIDNDSDIIKKIEQSITDQKAINLTLDNDLNIKLGNH